MLWEETRVAHKRINSQYRTQATVMLMAVSTAMAGGKKAGSQFKKFLENFDGESG